jgi:hypothetical protein
VACPTRDLVTACKQHQIATGNSALKTDYQYVPNPKCLWPHVDVLCAIICVTILSTVCAVLTGCHRPPNGLALLWCSTNTAHPLVLYCAATTAACCCLQEATQQLQSLLTEHYTAPQPTHILQSLGCAKLAIQPLEAPGSNMQRTTVNTLTRRRSCSCYCCFESLAF